MNGTPAIISGLGEIAGDYDALVCDVWGVLHNGVHAFEPAVDALRRFRAERGKVLLLTNAPRPPHCIEPQLRAFGVPVDCYDAVVTSGGAARADLARRGHVRIMHLGPDRDSPLFEELDVELAGPESAELILCTGLFDDDNETPEHYREILDRALFRRLPMICANPDVLVQRGDKLVHCAGSVARFYEELGGRVAYYGKPHAPIYAAAMEAAGNPGRPLVIGDGLATDIRGANLMGYDALFVTDGIHREELGEFTPENLHAFFAAKGAYAYAAVAALKW
jgi:HAD superfamily hydrolase (TIGR01459 family)